MPTKEKPTPAELSEKRRLLITKVQDIGRSMDALAQSAAMDAVRYSDDKEKKEQARHYVTIADARRKATDEAIALISAYWPNAV